jgi:hypothetical protein
MLMSRTKYLLVLLAVLMAPALTFAKAEAPKWGYIEAGYTDFNPDEGDSDNGWFAGGSMNLFKNFHLIAEYDDTGIYTFWNAGGGWHGLLGEKADLFGQIEWANVKVEDSDVNDSGYELQAGVRWKVIKWLEVSGQANRADYGGDTGTDTTYGLGGLFTFLNDRMGVGAKWDTGDSSTTRVFFRFNFGK